MAHGADTRLATWADLNACMTEAEETECLELLKLEARGRKRKQFLLRIHSRLNKVRADQERADLVEVAWGSMEPKEIKWLR